MASPPAPTVRRALIGAACLLAVAAGLLGAVWAIGWALQGGPQPSVETVASATRLDLPQGTDIVDADLTQMETPTPGDRAEVTLDLPAEAFADFIADNGFDAPLVAGTTPTGYASGIIPAGCDSDICWSGTLVVAEDTITVRLQITLL
ncbi:hypothetical protein AB0B28_14140 [Glycomyces sp. NPDC046736]|uniref:hypothetical protein n=1 Tax=Glycomyces sp. NPDC046736 TaxID=3155615 RepID=UPI0033FABAC8